MNWNEIFEYRDGKLYWKVRTSNRVKIGDEVKHSHRLGYARFSYMGEAYLAHRVIWEMHNGKIPKGMEVDHIWHNPEDNRIENLRLVSHVDNIRNMSKSKANTSGITGVYWVERVSKWSASIKVNYKKIHLGYFESRDKAAKSRARAEIKYGFHENHGV